LEVEEKGVHASEFEAQKEELEQTKKDNNTMKDKLKLVQEYNLSYRKQIDTLKKKLEEKTQLVSLL